MAGAGVTPRPTPWIQVLGRVAVHDGEAPPRTLTAAGQRLISVLIAAGPTGATAERIADALWAEQQPNPWRPALRMSVARLRRQLPSTWDVVSEGGGYRLALDGGWIDIWRLDSLASGNERIDEADLEWAIAGMPFADVDVVELVGEATEHARLLQTEIAERFCLQAPSELSPATCSILTGLVRTNAYNERLALVIAECLANAGRRSEAVAAVVNFLDSFREEFDWTPDELAAFVSGSGEPTQLVHAEPRDHEVLLPRGLRQLADQPFMGRAAELAQLGAADRAVIIAPSGAGKSRLLAELINARPNVETTYVAGDEGPQVPLGAFAAAIPELRSSLLDEVIEEPILARDDGSRDRAASALAWRVVLDYLEQRVASQQQLLVVDDAHQLDPASVGLLRLLVRSNTQEEFGIIVSGPAEHDDPLWASIVDDARKAGFAIVELPPLEVAEVEEIVGYFFPESRREARAGLAVDVVDAGGGLPATALPLIAAADPETLALPDHIDGATGLVRIAGRLSPRTVDVAGAAAVLGRRFSVSTLIALVADDDETVLSALDELWSAGLLEETEDPDLVCFSNVLVQAALADNLPSYRKAQLHQVAADLVADPHEVARHLANAGSLVPAHEAARSLLLSAEEFALGREWRRVVAEIGRAEALVGDLDARSLAMLAGALDRSGADGTDARRRAYDAAIADARWDDALVAALSGLPEAERPDGDLERIEMLEAIPQAAVSPELRFDHLLATSRQHALAGNAEQALRRADRAIALAAARQETDEIALAHAARWTAVWHLRPEPHEFPPDLWSVGSLSTRVRIAQMSAIGAAETGNFALAAERAQRFHRLALELGDPLREWQCTVMRSMLARGDGRFAASRQLTDEALDFAQLHGLQQGTSTWAGQVFHDHDLEGRAAELWPTLRNVRANLVQSSLARGAMVLVQLAAGEGDPTADVSDLVLDALERPRSSSVVVLAMLAPAVRVLTPHLIDRVRAVLEPFVETSLLVGFGIANIGPVARYVAELMENPAERAAMLQRSVVIADRHGPLLWRVMNRLELAAAVGGPHRDAAIELAHGTDLEALVSIE